MYHQAAAYLPHFKYETRPSCTMVLAAYIRVALYRIAFSSTITTIILATIFLRATDDYGDPSKEAAQLPVGN